MYERSGTLVRLLRPSAHPIEMLGRGKAPFPNTSRVFGNGSFGP
jgi:hypothetical protein